jgi:hypothetical protein
MFMLPIESALSQHTSLSCEMTCGLLNRPQLGTAKRVSSIDAQSRVPGKLRADRDGQPVSCRPFEANLCFTCIKASPPQTFSS